MHRSEFGIEINCGKSLESTIALPNGSYTVFVIGNFGNMYSGYKNKTPQNATHQAFNAIEIALTATYNQREKLAPKNGYHHFNNKDCKLINSLPKLQFGDCTQYRST